MSGNPACEERESERETGRERDSWGLIRVRLSITDISGSPARWVWVVGCGVWGVGCGVWGAGCGVWTLMFGVWGLGFGVWGLGFGVWGLGFGVWG